MVLNVQDEVINGTPKYNITPNGDGTNSIELANEITQSGTPLNKALFDKIENVLSYQIPSVTTISESQTYNNFVPNTSSGINISDTRVSQFSGHKDTTLESEPSYTGTDIKTLFTNSPDGILKVTGYGGYKEAQYILEIPLCTASLTITAQSAKSSYRRSYIRTYFNNTLINSTKIEGAEQTINITLNNDVNKIVFHCDTDATTTGLDLQIKKILIDNLTIVSNDNRITLETLTQVLNNQIVNLQMPSTTEVDNVSTNELVDIDIDTILLPSKYYELVYNSSQNKFIAQEVRN